MDALPNPPRYRRPTPRRTGPDRSAGNIYRSVGHLGSVSGVSQATLEARSAAVLRASTRVANEHFERLKRFGERMHRAGEEAVGPDPEAKALDHAERLAGNAAMAAIAWLEGVAAEPGSPWHRLATAQYRLIGKALGLAADGATAASTGRGQERSAERPAARNRAPRLEIVHSGPISRRVDVRASELPRDAGAEEADLVFWADEDGGAVPVKAKLRMAGGNLILDIELEQPCDRGDYTAALCTKDRRQVGWIRIEV